MSGQRLTLSRRNLWIRRLVATGLMIACCFGASTLNAASRYALIVGNDNYTNITSLANAVNDAGAIEHALLAIGFNQENIRVLRNATRKKLLSEIAGYAQMLKSTDGSAINFFFYAGHGIAQNGINYFVPIDAQENQLIEDSVALRDVVKEFRRVAPKATHLIVSDACRSTRAADCNCSPQRRDTPIVGGWARARGFVPLIETSDNGRSVDMLIAYSTQLGEAASDQGSGTGPYVGVLQEELVKPRLSAIEVFEAVRTRVAKNSGQQPVYHLSSGFRPIYLASGRGEAPLPGEATLLPSDRMIEDIKKMRKSGFFRPLAGTKILWVDDNPRNNFFSLNELRQAGILVDVATSTKGAQRHLWQNGINFYDVIISDFKRGVEEEAAGFRLLEFLKAQGDYPPYIIYSYGFTQEMARDAEKRGAMIQIGDTPMLMNCIREARLGPSEDFQCPRLIAN